MRYSTVLFDLDGTLVDSSPGILASNVYAAKKLGIPPITEAQIPRIMGPSLLDNARDYYHLEGARAQQFVAAIREQYDTEGVYMCRIYPGIPRLLEELQAAGIKTAVCTMKNEEQAVVGLRHFGLARHLDLICGIDDDHPTEKWQTIDRCLALLDVTDRREVALVGDTLLDAQAAHRSHLDFVAATYGFGFRNGELSRAQAVCAASSVQELSRFFLNIPETQKGG